jgi:hypothetical protein
MHPTEKIIALRGESFHKYTVGSGRWETCYGGWPGQCPACLWCPSTAGPRSSQATEHAPAAAVLRDLPVIRVGWPTDT